MRQRTAVVVLVVGLALVCTNAHAAYGAGIALPIVGETDGKAIEGNPLMVITAAAELPDGSSVPIDYDTIPAIPAGSRIKLTVTLVNLTIRPEADATLGIKLGVGGWINYEEYLGRVTAEKSYEETSRKELRRAKLGSTFYPGRWISSVRTGRVQYREQKRGQNGPLIFVGYIEPQDLVPDELNSVIVRVHGIMEQRTTPFLVLGKHGKSVFGTYDEPWLVMVEPETECPEEKGCPEPDPMSQYVTREEFLRTMEEFRGSIIAEVKQAISEALDRVALGGPTTPRVQAQTEEPKPIPAKGLTEPADKTTIRFKGEGAIVRVIVEGSLPQEAMFWWSICRNGNWGEWPDVQPSQMSRNGDWATFRLNLKGYNGERLAAGVSVGGEFIAYEETPLGGGGR